ncbi:hypothetical protein GCM10015535_37210 [Streptomyces gelaticus]|uniref:Uncharacterized protein n=1 Tax=Streptomyces gelaticus TaxID=285446 RepID=A0ABQ2W029_9ACTN|nr:hypothetical protein [Streptomyces gelaticus]GGV87468.1 hypothetical protein GCM10015535_37210 [Streptomyces gelaticus]
MVQKPESDTEPKERRIDLSLPQVAGSAVAAVAAAVAASQLGVYGTVLGAGVMSVVATCGGSVFQHFFRRTGEQIREVTVQVKHPGREVTVHTRETKGARAARREARRPTAATPSRSPSGPPDGAADATTVMPAVDATTVLRRADAGAAPRDPADDPDRTRMLRPLDATQLLTTGRPDPHEEFSEATTHGTRVRGWKRSVLGAAVVFVLTMAGITTYELISGNGLSGGQGTTVGSVVRGGERSSGSDDPAPPTSTDPGQGTPRENGTTPGTDQQGGGSRNPDSGGGDRSSADPTPSPTPSGGTGDRTSPSPVAPGDGASAGTAPAGGGEAPAQGDATAGTDTGR